MRIAVDESGFTWDSADGSAHSATVLRAPAICVFERIDVWRDGAPFDTGIIHQIDDEGYDGFEGFEGLFGQLTQLKELESSTFKVGDELRIDLLRANIPESVYWSGMTG
jgi:hypothetical protein